jgi:hypothetical protein
MMRQRSAPEGEINTLCQSCRRTCKQPILVLIASCPRYYAGMKPEKKKWRQMSLLLESAAEPRSQKK